MSGALKTIQIGFIPLIDASPLIVAAQFGFAEAEGLQLHLTKETSWANIRDRVAVGHFAAAHMLAPMAIAGSLGLAPLPVPIVAPMALGGGRNAITVSKQLWQDMQSCGGSDPANAALMASSLAAAKEKSFEKSRKLVFAVVHPYSAHAYLLRYWLAAGGLRPDVDVSIEVVPPPFMSDALTAGRIDGFCAGEPWNTVACADGAGHVAVTSSSIWPNGPDKVLGLRADWAEANAETVLALVRAIHAAAAWCDDPQNHAELAETLSQDTYLQMSSAQILMGIAGKQEPANCVPPHFALGNATFPWRSHAVWFLSQMARWDQAGLTDFNIEIARKTYRPDIYRMALGHRFEDIPEADDRVEGDNNAAGLFDGRLFDPTNAAGYLASLTD